MFVSVIAVHNTVGDVKPIWLLRDGQKKKIEKINAVVELPGLTVYHCVIDGQMTSLRFDGAVWSLD